MHLGAVLPTCEIGTDPIALRDWAQAAESLADRDLGCGTTNAHVSSIIGIGRSGGSDIASEGTAAATSGAVEALSSCR